MYATVVVPFRARDSSIAKIATAAGNISLRQFFLRTAKVSKKLTLETLNNP